MSNVTHMIKLLILLLSISSCLLIPTNPSVTLDEFLEYTSFPSINLSPDGHYLIIHTRRPLWDSGSYNNSLWLYEIRTNNMTLITDKLFEGMKPKWSPNGRWIAYLLNPRLESQRSIHLYSIESKCSISILIGTKFPLALAWVDDSSSLYLATSGSNPNNTQENSRDDEWKDVIEFRKPKTSDKSTIYHVSFDEKTQQANSNMTFITTLPFQVNELLFSSTQQKLVFTSARGMPTSMEDYEIYCMDPLDSSSLSQLTTNRAFEENLSLSMDGKHVLFTVTGLGPTNNKTVITQITLHALDLATGAIERLAKDFQGSITEYTIRSTGGICILGQWGTNVQIYTQQSRDKYTVLHHGWQGTYQSISTSFNSSNNLMAFVYSSHSRPREVYIVNDINQLETARAVTNENNLFTRRNMPRAKTYQWKNDDDDRTIEGILHYPPGLFESKNLPLLILIHGGPYLASTNQFGVGSGSWAALAATDGWLVLEPNYRGSTGYGDQFLEEIRYNPLSRPGRDILSGINHLITDGFVDRNRIAVGGYSYGGFLTNWLITQTTQFNVAFSGAGAVDQASMWGTMDLNLLIEHLWGGFPWSSTKLYVDESPIYHFGNVSTPTLITFAGNDVRVPMSQGYMLERALHYLDVPVQLLIFPNEGHLMRNNPWHIKIMFREQMNWLQKYGNTHFVKRSL